MSQKPTLFRNYGGTERVPRDWFSAFLASSVIYVGIALLLGFIGMRTREPAFEQPIDVTFVEQIVKPEPPPPPPPRPVEIRSEPPPAAAPVVPRNMKVRKLERPPPPKQLVAPKAMPRQAPPEADPNQDKGIAAYGTPGEGDPAGLEGGMFHGVAGGEVGPIELPDGALPPKPVKSNPPPKYPSVARRLGKTGSVTLKIVIRADGRVSDVEVVSGEEPFVSASVEAVRNWKYEPARYNGQPISVYRIIQVGFKLDA